MTASPPRWERVTRARPCAICGRPGWCRRSLDGELAACWRVDTGEGLHRQDKNGSDFWLYPQNGASTRKPSLQPEPQRADPGRRNAVYRSLLALLRLSPDHRRALEDRGLSAATIRRLEFRTLPPWDRQGLAAVLWRKHGSLCEGVPGWCRRGGHPFLAGAAGLLIPIVDSSGHLVACRVRADDASDDPRYSWLSSSSDGGPSAEAAPYWCSRPGSSGLVRLTEGELKAAVATELSGIPTVSIPGVTLWPRALDLLEQLGATEVLISFDADWRTNPSVARSLLQARAALVALGLPVSFEVWPPEHGKGIDDVLLAGHVPTRL